MAPVIRLTVFVLFSISLHLLVLQFEFSRKQIQKSVSEREVGFVTRPATQFAPLAPSIEVAVPVEPQIITPRKLINEPLQNKTEKKIAFREETANSALKLTEPALLQPPVKPDVALQAKDVEPVAEQTEKLTPHSQALSENVPTVELGSASASRSFAVTDTVAEVSLAPSSADEVVTFQEALPRYDVNPLPVYPEDSRRRGQEGTVQLEVQVLSDGRVGKSILVASSGYKSLDRAAQKSVRWWTFLPATSFGRAVESSVIVPIDFVLEK